MGAGGGNRGPNGNRGSERKIHDSQRIVGQKILFTNK